MAQLAIAAAGAFIGSALLPTGLTILGTAVSGAALGWTIGSLAGAALFPTKLPTQYGPRLSDLKVQSSAYGVGIPIVFGGMRTAGNVIWSPGIRERKKKKKSGGKGGPTQTVVTYTYSCSFAVGLCAGPIAGVRRIWADGVLIYDLGDAASAETIAASNQSAAGIRIYPGDETQLPDPTIEAHLGAGQVPAYRGLAYIVFTDLALAKFGNRVPNITAEIVTSGSTVDYRRLSATSLGLGYGDVVSLGWHDGVMRFAQPGGTVAHSIGPDGAYLGQSAYDGFLPSRSGRLIGSNYREQFIVATGATGDLIYDEADASLELGTATYPVLRAGDQVLDDLFPASRYMRGLAIDPGTETPVLFVLTSSSSSPSSNATHWYLLRGGTGSFGSSYAIDRSGTLTTPGSLGEIGVSTICSTGFGSSLDAYGVAVLEAERYVWLAYGSGNGQVECWEIGDDDVLRRLGILQVGAGLPSYNFAAPALAASDGICIAYCDGHSSVFTRATGLAPTAPSIGDIVGALCERAGLDAAEYDVSDLTDTVTGYALAQPTSARAAIEPLAAAFGFDAVESGDVMRFVQRGGAIAATIAADQLGAHAYGETPPPVLTTTRADEADLPRAVRVLYIDPAADYQQGAQEARRLQTASRNEATVELAVAMSAAQARSAALAILYRAWQGRESYKLAAARDYLALEPTDPIIAAGQRMRLISVARGANGVLQYEAEREDTGTIYGLTLPADGGTHAPQSVGLPGPTALAVLDLPALRDQDDDGGVYLAARGYLSGWEGAVVYRSADAGETWAEIDTLLDAATLGTATTALADGQATVWDFANTVTVRLLNGTLDSASESAVLNGANAAALGYHGRWEIIQWQTATLVGTNTYTLSGLLRGRRGTEWATGLHAIGDAFVLLDAADLTRSLLGSADYGVSRRWRGASVGLDTLSGDSRDIAAVPESLVPYSPVHLSAIRSVTDVGAWRYWELAFTAGGTVYATFADVQFRATVGGADQTGSGTASASSTYSAGWVASYAFDGSSSTSWSSAANYPHWLRYDFGAGNDKHVLEYVLQADPVEEEDAASAWELRYSSDATTWLVADEQSGQFFGLGEAKTYAVGGTLIVSWIRRARIAAEWRDGSDVPLDESVEQYRVRLLDVATGAPISGSEWTVTGTTTYIVSAAQLTTAYGSTTATARVEVAQIGEIGAGRTAEVIA